MFFHLVLDGVADGPLGVGLDVVGTAARLVAAGRAPVPSRAHALDQQLVSADGKPVRTGAGRVVAVDGALDGHDLSRDDVLLVPGLSAATEAQVATLLGRSDVVRAAAHIVRARERKARVAASCSATFLLASAGVLEGRSATTTWWLSSCFARRFPGIDLDAARMVVESRGVFTAGSAFAHADLLLAVLARHVSPTVAHLVASYLVLDARPSQARYMVREHLRSSDPLVRALERWLVDRIDRQVTVAEMAAAAKTSPRTLARRLQETLATTPIAFAQRLRIDHAVHLLETTDDAIDTIAERVGYADPAAFRRVFRRTMGEAPRLRPQRTRGA